MHFSFYQLVYSPIRSWSEWKGLKSLKHEVLGSIPRFMCMKNKYHWKRSPLRRLIVSQEIRIPPVCRSGHRVGSTHQPTSFNPTQPTKYGLGWVDRLSLGWKISSPRNIGWVVGLKIFDPYNPTESTYKKLMEHLMDYCDENSVDRLDDIEYLEKIDNKVNNYVNLYIL